MPIKYKYNPDENIVYTSADGEVCIEQLKEYFEAVLADENISNGFWEVVNTEDVINVTLTFKECVALSSQVKKFVSEKDYKGALLYAPNKLPGHAIRLLFKILNSVLSQTFCIESNPEKFKKLVKKYLHVKYTFA